ncbi:hypothetical protein [Desulfovulcanus sp.]
MWAYFAPSNNQQRANFAPIPGNKKIYGGGYFEYFQFAADGHFAAIIPGQGLQNSLTLNFFFSWEYL